MSCPDCAGYSLPANSVCPSCYEPKEELTAYEQGAVEALCRNLDTPNPFENSGDSLLTVDWECGFYELLQEIYNDKQVEEIMLAREWSTI